MVYINDKRCLKYIGIFTGGPGGNVVNPTQWDDLLFPVIGQRLDTSAGRIDYNFTELSLDFADNARYPEETIGFIIQLPHKYKLESDIRFHIHWMQNQDETPNWMYEYRKYKNGNAVPASFTQGTFGTNSFDYGTGSELQISYDDLTDMTGTDSVSSFIDFKIYRDVNNTSGLFAGVDPYTGIASLKEFDIHYQMDSAGSTTEFVK